MKKHDFFKLMDAVRHSLANDYARIRSRSRDDPGTAGDQAEEDWADILRNWLPANYRVVTKGRILFEDGSSSPQMDVLVLTPSYPKGLGNEKYIFSGGVVAAFECKLTLRKSDIKRAFEAAATIKRKAKPRSGNPYDELNRTPIVGLLAHSQSLGKGRKSEKLYDAVKEYQAECCEHPRELLDIICVADSATVLLGKSILIGPGLNNHDAEELKELNVDGAIAAIYVIHDEDAPQPSFSGKILAGLIHELTYRLAFEDASIRSWADHLSDLGSYLGIGQRFYCTQEYLSASVRRRLIAKGCEDDRWSKWNRHLP